MNDIVTPPTSAPEEALPDILMRLVSELHDVAYLIERVEPQILEVGGENVLQSSDTMKILQGIDLVLCPGTVTVLVGPSGCGKSTLARALVGAWPDCSGQLLLDGRPLAQWPQAELGPQVGFLPQEVALFEGTVAENIARCGVPDPQRVIAAAQCAGLHEMILRLPRGYDTPVGDPGAPLSGGQQQRIALARAIYGAPRLVVLDEPNANLDEAGEAALAALVRTLRADGATVLVVTHRPAILSEADRLLVMGDGRIERDGAPAKILTEVRQAHSAPARPTSSSPAALAEAATPSSST